eukprot:scaffold49997_cov59-Phaeocystis_antarctica.AAC.3
MRAARGVSVHLGTGAGDAGSQAALVRRRPRHSSSASTDGAVAALSSVPDTAVFVVVIVVVVAVATTASGRGRGRGSRRHP